MGWIDIVIMVVLVYSVWSGHHAGTIRTTVSVVSLLIGLEFASRNYQRFAKELAPMVHSLPAADAIWFVLQVFIVMRAFSFIGNAIHHELIWVDTIAFNGVVGGLLGLVRGVMMGCVCIMSVAAFFPGADTLPDAIFPKYLVGTTAVLTNLTERGLHARIIHGLEATEPDATPAGNPTS